MTGIVGLHGGGEFLAGDERFLRRTLEASAAASGPPLRVVIVPTAAARHRPELAGRHGVEALGAAADAAGIAVTSRSRRSSMPTARRTRPRRTARERRPDPHPGRRPRHHPDALSGIGGLGGDDGRVAARAPRSSVPAPGAMALARGPGRRPAGAGPGDRARARRHAPRRCRVMVAEHRALPTDGAARSRRPRAGRADRGPRPCGWALGGRRRRHGPLARSGCADRRDDRGPRRRSTRIAPSRCSEGPPRHR